MANVADRPIWLDPVTGPSKIRKPEDWRRSSRVVEKPKIVQNELDVVAVVC